MAAVLPSPHSAGTLCAPLLTAVPPLTATKPLTAAPLRLFGPRYRRLYDEIASTLWKPASSTAARGGFAAALRGLKGRSSALESRGPPCASARAPRAASGQLPRRRLLTDAAAPEELHEKSAVQHVHKCAHLQDLRSDGAADLRVHMQEPCSAPAVHLRCTRGAPAVHPQCTRSAPVVHTQCTRGAHAGWRGQPMARGTLWRRRG